MILSILELDMYIDQVGLQHTEIHLPLLVSTGMKGVGHYAQLFILPLSSTFSL